MTFEEALKEVRCLSFTVSQEFDASDDDYKQRQAEEFEVIEALNIPVNQLALRDAEIEQLSKDRYAAQQRADALEQAARELLRVVDEDDDPEDAIAKLRALVQSEQQAKPIVLCAYCHKPSDTDRDVCARCQQWIHDAVVAAQQAPRRP